MKFSLLPVFVLTATVMGREVEHEKPELGKRMQDVQGKISSLIGMIPGADPDFTVTQMEVPKPTLLDGAGKAPKSLLNAVMSAIPSGMMGQLLVPASREALASEFRAGNTPSWYKNLPTDVKSYFQNVAAEMTSEGIDLPTEGPVVTTGGLTLPTAEPTGDEAQETSSEDIAARPTGAVAGSLAVAAGVLGAALAL